VDQVSGARRGGQVRVAELAVGLLTYYVGTSHVYALLTNQQGRTKRFRLASCQRAFPLVDRLASVTQQPTEVAPTELARVYQDFCHAWGCELLPPPKELRPFDVLVIIPHQFIHGLPLHLVSLGDDFLATTHGVAYCSSGTLFARCVERNRARQSDASDWVFDESAGENESTGEDDNQPSKRVPPRRRRPHLAGPQRVVYYGVDVLTRKDAAYRELAASFASHFPTAVRASSRDEVKDALYPSFPSRPDAICIICHGYYDPVSADRSGLLVAGRRGVRSMRNIRVHRDTILRVKDHPFAEIPLHLDPTHPDSAATGIFDPETLTVGELKVHGSSDAELIALFGCSTGTGLVTSADEYDSLAYQWLKAGAASVVANLWEADLPTVAEWADLFAANWVRLRQPKAIAARNATRRILSRVPDRVNQPFVWGSLALLGDWL
jgi:CHAT domain-containing protein